MDTNEFLAHYGVKGTQWGVRNDRRTNTSSMVRANDKRLDKMIGRAEREGRDILISQRSLANQSTIANYKQAKADAKNLKGLSKKDAKKGARMLARREIDARIALETEASMARINQTGKGAAKQLLRDVVDTYTADSVSRASGFSKGQRAALMVTGPIGAMTASEIRIRRKVNKAYK